jgi:hypothetical protein
MVKISSAFIVVATTLFASAFAAPAPASAPAPAFAADAADAGYGTVANDFDTISELVVNLDEFLGTNHSLNGDFVSTVYRLGTFNNNNIEKDIPSKNRGDR